MVEFDLQLRNTETNLGNSLEILLRSAIETAIRGKFKLHGEFPWNVSPIGY